MTTTTIDESRLSAQVQIRDLRVDPQVSEGLIRTTIRRMGVPALASRLESDGKFMFRAMAMVQDLVVSTTLAQSLTPDTEFSDVLAARSFAGGDDSLRQVGLAMFTWIANSARLQDAEISNELLSARLDQIGVALSCC